MEQIKQKLNDLNDQQCLELVLTLLNTRVSVNTVLLQGEGTDNVTHEMIRIECGDYITASNPQELEVPLRYATAEETGEVVN